MQYLSGLALKLAQRLSSLERYVVGSGLTSSLSEYFETSIKLFILTTSTLLPIISVVVTVQYDLGFLSKLTVILTTAALITFISMLVVVTLPKILHVNRGYRLEAKYPSLLYIFSSLIVSGLGPTKALLELSNFKELEEFKLELEQITNQLHLGKSLDDIINYLTMITPSKSLASLLMVIGSIARGGYDPLPVINHLIDSYFIEVRTRIEEAISFIGILSEAFVAVVLIFPLIVSVIASTTSLMPLGIINPYMLMIVTTLVIVPAASLTYYILVDYIMSSVYI